MRTKYYVFHSKHVPILYSVLQDQGNVSTGFSQRAFPLPSSRFSKFFNENVHLYSSTVLVLFTCLLLSLYKNPLCFLQNLDCMLELLPSRLFTRHFLMCVYIVYIIRRVESYVSPKVRMFEIARYQNELPSRNAEAKRRKDEKEL